MYMQRNRNLRAVDERCLLGYTAALYRLEALFTITAMAALLPRPKMLSSSVSIIEPMVICNLAVL